jgi:hypothetical protein
MGRVRAGISARHSLFATAPPAADPINVDLTMAYLCRCLACSLAVLLLAATVAPGLASEQAFPFGSELMLDQAPLRGSKRVPILEIEENGAASIDLWCASARAQATVGGASITIVPGQIEMSLQTASCAPERQSSDAGLLDALAQVTAWRRDGDMIELLGATTLRFRLMTN